MRLSRCEELSRSGRDLPTEAECRGGYAGARKQIAELRFLLIVSMLEPRRKLKYQITRF